MNHGNVLDEEKTLTGEALQFWRNFAQSEAPVNFVDNQSECSLRRGLEMDAIGPVLDRFSAGSRVLEIGAGDGFWTQHLASRNFRITAVEPVAEYYTKLHTIKPACEQILLQTVNRFDPGDQVFDIIFIVGTWMYLSRAERMRVQHWFVRNLRSTTGKIILRSTFSITGKAFEVFVQKTGYAARYDTIGGVISDFPVNASATDYGNLFDFSEAKGTVKSLLVIHKIRPNLNVLSLGIGETAMFLTALREATGSNDITVNIDLRSDLPSRTRAVLFDEESPRDRIEKIVRRKTKMDPSAVVIIPCNSAHLNLRLENEPRFVSLTELVRAKVGDSDNIVVLAGAAGERVYSQMFPRKIDVKQSALEDIIEGIKHRRLPKEDASWRDLLVDRDAEVDVVVLACTDLTALHRFRYFRGAPRILDSLEILAEWVAAAC